MKYWITQTGLKLRPNQMGISHIENCIRMLNKVLDEYPGDQVYIGDSDYADQAVDSENRINRDRKENIVSWINLFKKELANRSKSKTL